MRRSKDSHHRHSGGKVNPPNTAQLVGANIPSGVRVSLKLEMVSGGQATSAASRLLTSSVTIPSDGSFGPVPIVLTNAADAGQTIRLTASVGQFSLVASAPVKIATALSLTVPSVRLEGLNTTVLAQLTRIGAAGSMTGNINVAIGSGAPSSAVTVNTTALSTIASFPKTSVAAGIQPVLASYSGDATHEGATASGSFTVVTRTPTVVLSAVASAPVGTPVQLTVTTSIPGAPANSPDLPPISGRVNFFQSGFPIGAPPGSISSTTSVITGISVVPQTLVPMTFTASYEGDTNYRSAGSNQITLTPVSATPTLSISALPAKFTCGTPTPVTATLNFPTSIGLANRSVNFSFQVAAADGSVRPITSGTSGVQATLVPGTIAGTAVATASLVIPFNAVGITAEFAGDGLLRPAVAAGNRFSMNPIPVTLKLGIVSGLTGFADMPATLTNPANLAAVVSASSSCGVPVVTGAVEFLEDTTSLGVVALQIPPFIDGSSNTILIGQTLSSQAKLLVSRPTGQRSLSIKYGGDASHATGQSNPVTVTFQ